MCDIARNIKSLVNSDVLTDEVSKTVIMKQSKKKMDFLAYY